MKLLIKEEVLRYLQDQEDGVRIHLADNITPVVKAELLGTIDIIATIKEAIELAPDISMLEVPKGGAIIIHTTMDMDFTAEIIEALRYLKDYNVAGIVIGNKDVDIDVYDDLLHYEEALQDELDRVKAMRLSFEEKGE